MHITWLINLPLKRTRRERPLLALQNMEIIITGVQARMSLRAERRPKDNKVLRQARMDDIHRAHRAARVAEDPLVRARIQGDTLAVAAPRGGGDGAEEREGRGRGLWVLGREVREDVVDHGARVVPVRGHAGLGDGVDEFGVEDVELFLIDALIGVKKGFGGLEKGLNREMDGRTRMESR